MKFNKIKDYSQKLKLIGEMVRLQNQVGLSSFEWALMIKDWFLDMPTEWYLVDLDGSINQEMSNSWINEYGMWKHNHGKKTNHNILGMAFAWWGLNKSNWINEICLSDSPDLSGILLDEKGCERKFYGDVGMCTPNAVINGISYTHNIHDRWISVLDWNRVIVIEFHYSPSLWSGSNRFSLLGDIPSNEKLRERFDDSSIIVSRLFLLSTLSIMSF